MAYRQWRLVSISIGCSSVARDRQWAQGWWQGPHCPCSAQANNVALRFDTAVDTVTGLRHKTIFGRPMWNSEFTAVAAAHPR